MALITAHELKTLTDEEHAANFQRVETALNDALKRVKLSPPDMRVVDLYIPRLQPSDKELAVFLMLKAGYADIKVTTCRAEYGMIDTHISFSIPPR